MIPFHKSSALVRSALAGLAFFAVSCGEVPTVAPIAAPTAAPAAVNSQPLTRSVGRIFPEQLRAATLTSAAFSIAASDVLWDAGPARGLANNGCWSSQADNQNFVERFVLVNAVTIHRMMAYTCSFFQAGDMRIRIRSDDNGMPGELLYEADVTGSPGVSSGLVQPVELELPEPFATEPNKAYWIGASGASADAGQISFATAIPGGDGVTAQYSGSNFFQMAGVGDMMFQLFGEAPPNSAPTVSLPASASINEGFLPANLTATGFDADGDPLTYRWDINNDGVIDSVKATNTISLRFLDNGNYPVTVTVDDFRGGNASVTTTVRVANVAPTIFSITPATTLTPGSPFTLVANFSDPGTHDAPFVGTIDWGDNTTETVTVTAQPLRITKTHAYTASGTFTVSLTVKDKDGGVSAPKTVVVTTGDATPAVITPAIAGTQGTGGWYTGDVNVSWTVTDAESGVASRDGCDAVVVSTDTPVAGIVITCTAKNGAGQTSTKSVTILRDASVPTVTPAASGPLNGVTGWYTGDVSVSWAAVANGPSGATASCPVATINNDTAGQALTCTATTGAGNTATGHITIKRDATKPLVAIVGNAGTYTIDQTINITCSMSDALSGVAVRTCNGASGTAYAIGLGVHAVTAAATDNAGNSQSASGSFTVSVTTTSLSTLVTGWVTDAGVAGALTTKLANAQAAMDRGNTNAADNVLDAFINQVQAQSGKSIPAEQAALLIDLARAMK